MLDRLTNRLLALLGLDLDFSFSMGTERFSRITENLYLGARPGREHIDTLKEAGITHVVSCLSERDRAKVDFLHEDFRPLFVPIHDGMHEDISAAFPALFAFVARGRALHAEAKLLIHCEAGVSRSATMAIALLMQSSRTRFFDTFQQVRAKRVGILPNIGFASQLQRLEFELEPTTPGHDVSSLARYLHEICLVPIELDTLENMLHEQDYDSVRAIQAIFGAEIPRVIQGVRV